MPRPALWRLGPRNTHPHHTDCACNNRAASVIMTLTVGRAGRVTLAGKPSPARKHGEIARVRCAWCQKGGELHALCRITKVARLKMAAETTATAQLIALAQFPEEHLTQG